MLLYSSGLYVSRYNSIPHINPQGIRTIPFNNTLVSIWTQLYPYSIPHINPQGMRTIPFNNTLVSMSIRTQLYVYTIPHINSQGMRTIPFNNTLVSMSIRTQLYLYTIPLVNPQGIRSSINVNLDKTLSLFFGICFTRYTETLSWIKEEYN